MGGREEDRPAGGTTSTAASLVVAHHLHDQPEEVAPINSARRGLVPDGGRSHWVKLGTRKGKLIVLCGFLLL